MQVRGDVYILELAITGDELRFRDFGEIVILGGDPENRYCLCSSLLQAAGEFYGGECFVDCVEWAGKQTRLLAGNNGDAIRLAQQVDILQRRLAGAPALVHCRERVADFVSMRRVRG